MQLRTAIVGFGLVALSAGALLIWRIAELPRQPAHITRARVIAVAPGAGSGVGRLPLTYIVIRNAHATGQFDLREPEVRCEVGQNVQVRQRGVTLTPLPTTCK
jgi:hypothetical protein